MSKKVRGTSEKIKKRPKMIPYKKSELFFVFKTKSRNVDETIIIDGPAKIIKKILLQFDCEIKQNHNKINIVTCAREVIKLLKEMLYNFQEQHIIKFVVFCPCKCRSKIKHEVRNMVSKVTFDENGDDHETIYVNIPKDDTDIIRDEHFAKYKGRNVKIVASSVDGVARSAKLMGVLLHYFNDNCLEGKFTAYGIVH